MKAEIITIGTELLLGQIIDTNAAFIAQQLANIGFDVYKKTTVGDNEVRISDAISKALKRSDVVITTGGLGPTVDDKTREAVAMATERELVLDEKLLQEIKEFFKRRGLKLGKNNPLQAQIPTGFYRKVSQKLCYFSPGRAARTSPFNGSYGAAVSKERI
jgi:nicotinamide-nucleotide amidase